MNAPNVSLEQAQALDTQDPLAGFRDQFHLPRREDGSPEIYLVGNSLGLQPTRTAEYIHEALADWQRLGVRGHFEGSHPWMPYHEFLTAGMASLVGALPEEVVMMNGLTVNLHLMLVSFYRPAGKRSKILMEKQAFPSDFQAVSSQIEWHGLEPAEALIQVPRDEMGLTTTEGVLETLERHRGEWALILLPGVQYYTGQRLDLPRIVEAARREGCLIGFDLAHAAGNVPLQLHDWDVDFAVWCSYKYLNSGPGSVAGCFVHERHARDLGRHRLAGWWGHEKQSRFLMKNEFRPIPTAEGWQLSNPPVLSMAAIRASLDVFQEAGGMTALRRKSLALTGYLEACLDQKLGERARVITPSDPEQRGAQLTLEVAFESIEGKAIHDRLEAAGVRTDWREPNGIRCAPVPLYNSFTDVWHFADALADLDEGSAGERARL